MLLTGCLAQVSQLLDLGYALHGLRRNQVSRSGHMDMLAGLLLARAPSMSLLELQAAASLMQSCRRRDDLRAFQAHFVRAVNERQQLHGQQNLQRKHPKKKKART